MYFDNTGKFRAEGIMIGYKRINHTTQFKILSLCTDVWQLTYNKPYYTDNKILEYDSDTD